MYEAMHKLKESGLLEAQLAEADTRKSSDSLMQLSLQTELKQVCFVFLFFCNRVSQCSETSQCDSEAVGDAHVFSRGLAISSL